MRAYHQTHSSGKARILRPFVEASTILGALSMPAREMVKGRTPRDMSMPSFWTDALQQGGGLSIFQQLLETQGGFDRAPTQAGGPAVDLARDVYNLTAGNAIESGKGKDAHLGRDVSKFAERYTSGTNLWQTRLLAQRLVWNNFQRMLDPDAEESFAKQAAAPERWGSQYWWPPGE
jgi:hypothetical protein